MKNKLKVLVAAVALVAVGLVAAHPGAGSSGDVARTGMAPVQAGIGIASFDDLVRKIFKAAKRIESVLRPASELPGTIDDVLRQHSLQPNIRRVQAATSKLRDDQRVRLVAEACDVKDDLEALAALEANQWIPEWTAYDQAKARIKAAEGNVGDIVDGVEALWEVLQAFAEGSEDRYQTLAEEAVCQAAGQLAS
jgi:hypothetical protein